MRGRRLVAVTVAAVLAVSMSRAATSDAQDLEPRAYANAPVGLNFLILGYGYQQGDVAFDPSVPIEDAKLTVHATFLAYARALDVWGRAGKIDMVLPYAWLSGTASVLGRPQERAVSGFSDPRLRFSWLLYGAPALSPAEFADYKSDLIVGGSVAVTAPLGQYDGDKLVNIGTNRWSVKPEVGISKTLGALTLELDTGVTFYTTNDDFFGGHTLKRDPLYAVQGHVIYQTRWGIWGAVDTTYYSGGATTIDNGKRGERQENLRFGATVAIPVDRRNSVKLYGSTGAISRIGGNFDTVGIAWQYRWGGGL
jgi:hypothetical protein